MICSTGGFCTDGQCEVRRKCKKITASIITTHNCSMIPKQIREELVTHLQDIQMHLHYELKAEPESKKLRAMYQHNAQLVAAINGKSAV